MNGKRSNKVREIFSWKILQEYFSDRRSTERFDIHKEERIANDTVKFIRKYLESIYTAREIF